MNIPAIADAIAARFAALAAPAGLPVLDAVRLATADAPAALGMLPAVVVFLEAGELETGNSSRVGVTEYLARFYLEEAADLERDTRSLMRWAEVLIDRLKGAVQLAGLVDRAVVSGFTVGLLPYAGRQYAGIELSISVTTSEGWVATA